jgi:hypothetical protein
MMLECEGAKICSEGGFPEMSSVSVNGGRRVSQAVQTLALGTNNLPILPTLSELTIETVR